MSGGQLVVLDRLGRDVKRYPLPEGLATIGSDPACDIRILLPTVSPHHATVVVHANQTVVRNVSTGETLVNGVPVSVAALRHRDTIEIGGRALRWEYSDDTANRPLAPQPALYQRTRALRGGSPRRGRRASAAPPAPPRSPAVRLALELQHRASVPAGGKQVAIVQPQRRDTAHHNGTSTPPRPNSSAKRSRSSNNDLDSSIGSEAETSKRKSNAARPSPRNTSLQSTTKASLWIESRKSSPRKSSRPHTPVVTLPVSGRRQPAARGAPLWRAQSAGKPRVTKIEAPLTVDHTKQAAILLMTRHTPKKSASPNGPSFLVKKRTPRATPRSTPASRSSTLAGSPANTSASPPRSASRASANSALLASPGRPASPAPRGSVRASASVANAGSPGLGARASRGRTLNGTNDVLVVEPSEWPAGLGSGAARSPQLSPLLPSPKKSALKNPAAKKSLRKTESIKFDLSNLDNYEDQSQDVFFVSDVTRKDDADDSQSDTDLTLHYESSIKSPSPRKSIHSRSSKILEKTLGTSVSEPQSSVRGTLTPESPRPRKSSRVSTIVQNALENSGNSRYSQRTTKSLSDESYDTTVASAFKTRTLSPRSPSQKNMESYSIVDLVSVDSNQSGSSSVYNSMRSTKSTDTAFGTPQNSTGRQTRSTIDPTLLTSSTPYVAKTRSSNQRSSSSPNVSRSSRNASQVTRGSSRRSKSLSTPENTQKHISVNSTRVSRGPRNRSRINDSDLLLISAVTDDESPKTSKRQSRAEKSILGIKSSVISPKRLSRGSKSMLSPKSPVESPKTLSRGSKSILSPKSPVASPKRLSRGSKSILSPKSSVSSPKNLSGGSKSFVNPKSPVSNPKRLSRGSKSTLSPKSPLTSPKQLNSGSKSIVSLNSPSLKGKSRRSKSIQSPESPIISPQSQSTLSKSVSTSQSPVLSPKRQSRASKSISSPKSPITSPQRQSRSSKPVSSPESPVSSPKRQSTASKSILSAKSPVISSKRTSRSSKSTLSPKSPVSSPKRAGRATKSIATASSPVLSPKSPKSSSKSPMSSAKANVSSTKNARNTRGTFTVNTPSGSPGNEGVSTPENRQSPVAVGTPVLSIQSLLDSSQSSLASQRSTKKGRGSLHRKTIGGIPPKPKKTRASLKSKSFNFGARRTASRLSKDSGASDKTVEGTAQEEDIVTPKSAVKLVQEAVKNKHSTAKKPQSKRSIIDDLNESDIGKHLFNSPVKRKLSQSMTEFSRKQLFDDDEVVVKRPTRNTVALGQTPDNSVLLNQTESYTPEVFVSPLGTPSNSPNLTGIKRLFKKQTPENDLRNVKGVKGLLKTPRTRRSIKNDLTRVSGVKNVFARSPRNRLSDVRVKEVFVASPRNDLRRVSGVKSLFRSQKKGRKSPKNDLRDVRGVKKLFTASSPANDLRNVSGVKRTLRRNSPRNDLTDVRGVKRMFGREKPRENMDVSGVEELFNESNNSCRDHSVPLSETLFDRLVGKPPIKAVYSRTFTKKADKSRRVRRGGALHVSIDEIIARPEDWVQKELAKRFQKTSGNAASRELINLATDTVAGAAPIRSSRARDSTLGRSAAEPAGQRSTADSYSAHTLPIKKRSLAELSAREQSSLARSPGAAPGARSPGAGPGGRVRVLPIKKRALVHSTPVKGRAANALPAELGRVSPIALADNSTGFTTTVVEVTDLQTTRRSTKAKPATPQAKTVSPKAKAASPKARVASPKAKAASPKTKIATPPAEVVVISPKKTRGKVTIVVSPKARVASPKAKAASPKTKIATPPAEVVVISPKKTRGKVTIVVSPKNTRKTKNDTVAFSPKLTRKSKNDSPTKKPTLVVAKKTAIMSPKPIRATKAAASPSKSVDTAQEATKSPTPQKKSTRKQKTVTELVTEEVKPKSPKRTRGKRVSLVISKPSPKMKPRPVKQSADTSKVQEVPEKTRRTRKTTAPTDDKKTESPKATARALRARARNRKTSEVPAKEETKAVKTKGKANGQKEPKINKDKSVEEKPSSKTRRNKADVSVDNKKVPAKATRGKKSDMIEQKVESPKKGRKTAVEVEKPVAQKRGRKTEEVEPKPEPQKRGGRGRKTVEIEKPVSPKRGKKSEVEKPVTTRRGRNTEPAEPVRGASKADTNRKRKSTAADEHPAKVRKTRAGDLAGAKAAQPDDKGPAPRGRQAARGKQPPAEAAPASRKRKTAADTPAKPAKDMSKRAKRVVVKPASPAAKPKAGAQAAPTAVKRSTRGKR